MRVLIIGSNGKMGKKMQSQLKKENIDFFGIDKENRLEAENYKCDVVVDFSTAECLKENLLLAEKKKVPIVIATTNHSADNLFEIEKSKKNIAIFMASNFSILFSVLLKMLKNLKILQENDIVVEEIHHKQKKDSPSGSCKEIIKVLEECGQNPIINSLRVGDVVGNHSVSIYGKNEILEISHRVFDRDVFCQGVVKACKFIIEKKSGLFNMNDLI